MTIRHPKRLQGRKDTRLKPPIAVPLNPTGAHLKIDKVLTRKERQEAEQARIEQARAHKRAVAYSNRNWKRAMDAYRKAHKIPGQTPPNPQQPHKQEPHRHHYKKLLRVNPETGNRVVSCNCGAYTVIPPEGKLQRPAHSEAGAQ